MGHNNKQCEGVHLKIGYPKSAGLSSYVPYQKCHCAVYPLFRHTQICWLWFSDSANRVPHSFGYNLVGFTISGQSDLQTMSAISVDEIPRFVARVNLQLPSCHIDQDKQKRPYPDSQGEPLGRAHGELRNCWLEPPTRMGVGWCFPHHFQGSNCSVLFGCQCHQLFLFSGWIHRLQPQTHGAEFWSHVLCILFLCLHKNNRSCGWETHTLW